MAVFAINNKVYFASVVKSDRQNWLGIGQEDGGKPQALVNAAGGCRIGGSSHMLPCLEKLVIWDSHDIRDSLENFMLAAARSGHVNGTPALSKLSRVEIKTLYKLDSQNARLIHLFTSFPSVSFFRALIFIDTDDKWTATHSNSRIRELTLVAGTLGPESLQRIISGIAALEDFSYEFRLEDDDRPVHFAPSDQIVQGKPERGPSEPTAVCESQPRQIGLGRLRSPAWRC